MKNSKGTVYYGMHFYPGVAEYQEAGREAYRVFLNEDTIRSMDPTFAGRPVFVMHVDGVDDNLDQLRREADGWVVESFYNQADGKHWVKFIVVSERGERAIRQGMRLSNCYAPKAFGQSGLWNGVAYSKEITGGEYEHLAIVPNPRYEESVILTPEKFKAYNEEKLVELKRLSNDKESGSMKLNLFKRTKIENAIDLEGLSVVLPKSGKEMTITQLVTDCDERLSNSPMNAHPDHLVDMGEGSKMSVNDLLAKHKQICDELEAYKKKNVEDPDEDGDPSHGKVDMGSKDKMNDGDGDGDGDDGMENAEDDDKKKKAEDDKKANDLKTQNDIADKKRRDKEKADRFRNAAAADQEVVRVELSEDRVARGKARYGST